jgi:hypothetical protein
LSPGQGLRTAFLCVCTSVPALSRGQYRLFCRVVRHVARVWSAPAAALVERRRRRRAWQPPPSPRTIVPDTVAYGVYAGYGRVWRAPCARACVCRCACARVRKCGCSHTGVLRRTQRRLRAATRVVLADTRCMCRRACARVRKCATVGARIRVCCAGHCCVCLRAASRVVLADTRCMCRRACARVRKCRCSNTGVLRRSPLRLRAASRVVLADTRCMCRRAYARVRKCGCSNTGVLRRPPLRLRAVSRVVLADTRCVCTFEASCLWHA